MGRSLILGTSLNFTAQLTNDRSGQGVTWSVLGEGTLENPTPWSVTYVAPSTSVSDPNVVLVATSSADSGASDYVPLTVRPLNTFANVQDIEVNGGPVAGLVYPNGAFTSVTVCVPGTTTCNTIDGILVDTGSSGLRILASALPTLPALSDSKGNSVSECVQFPDQSYLWGNVEIGDVKIGGEVARQLPLHAIAAPSVGQVPTDCSTNGAGTNNGDQLALGANGILGVGLHPQDCGSSCDPSAGGTPPGPAYYTCSGSCTATFVPLNKQVTHPAAFFVTDNNGVLLGLPTVSGATQAVSGSLIFGIGTQTNNILGNATIFTTDAKGHFTTQLSSTGQSLTSSVIDSGLMGFFFPDDALPQCASPNSVFFCPASSTSETAVNVGTDHNQNTINFSVDNADTLLGGNPTAAAFDTLAGSNGSGICSSGTGACRFDWGLPFFYGRTVFTPMIGQPMPDGVPAAPWFAYVAGFSKH
jgi:hypothetical protein